MTAADATPFCAMTPHALQLHVVAVPFWGLPGPSPLAVANADVTSMPATHAATAQEILPTISSIIATAPASAASTAAIASTAAEGVTTGAFPDKDSVAKTLHIAELAAAPVASVQPAQTPLTNAHVERQQKPCLPCDPINTASRLSSALGSSSATSTQHLVAGKHAVQSPPREPPLQLRTVAMPFCGLPAPPPAAAAIDDAMFSATLATAVPDATKQLCTDTTAIVDWSASASASASAADDALSTPCTTSAVVTVNKKQPTNSTATVSATATSAAIATGASVTTAAGGASTAVPLQKTLAAKLLHTADAEQAAAPAASVESSQTHLSYCDAKRQQKTLFFCNPTNKVSSLAATSANGNTASSQHVVADKHTTDSLSTGAIVDVPGAALAQQAQPRGSKRRPASAAAPTASRMVTRSQVAAQKHVQRMQTQYLKRR